MIVSLNWLKKYTNINLSIDDLTLLIGARLVEIEETVNIGEKYKDTVVAHVIEAKKMEGSDHLNVVLIDDGGQNKKVDRDSNGYIQVVCGASNIATGQNVVWLPPTSIVPSTYSSSEQFVLDSRSLRGVISNGMIASPKELDLSDEHEGILVLDSDIKSGTEFSKFLELDDYLLDIENKSLTHRPDCFGIVGFAREVSAIQGLKFNTPDWLLQGSKFQNNQINNPIDLQVIIDNSELSSRYAAVVMSDIDNTRQTPLIIQSYLSRIGIRPISAVVDVTNYLMMLTGQPLHAFDYDKLVAVSGGRPEIHVRAGRNGEKLELLDGRIISLSEEDIVIAAGETAIGLAGAMGGASTAIDKNTKNIIIESATFNLYNLRATQMRHGIFSEAITRFTKGQPAELSMPVLLEAIRLMGEWTNAKCVSKVVESYPVELTKSRIDFSINTVNSVLGSDIKSDLITRTLENVGFEVQLNKDGIIATAPYWRGDIHIVEDIIEEIGRLNGFDNINPTLPTRDFSASLVSHFDEFRSQIRKILVRSGANEVLTYNFIHGDVLRKSGQKESNSYKIINSISPDLQYYRQSLTPSLIGLVHPNIKQGHGNFALFELNKTHQKEMGLTEENVPVESDMIALVVANKNSQSGSAYYQAKKILDYLLQVLEIDLDYKTISNTNQDSLYAPFEYQRSARLVSGLNDLSIGIIGEYKKSVSKAFKLPDYAAGFEINVAELFELYQQKSTSYRQISRYPGSERDICFQIDNQITYSQIINAINDSLKKVELETSVAPVDIYQPDNGLIKNITVRIKMTSHDHTLTGDEVSAIVKSVSDSVVSSLRAKVI